VPGKVSRGPLHFLQAGGFSGLGRIILDKLERGVAFVALIYALDGQRDISTDVLREFYALTPAQAHVARSLFAGLSVEESAAALNLSLNTVRTHLKQIFTRCEVQSQAELLHLLAQGPQHLCPGRRSGDDHPQRLALHAELRGRPADDLSVGLHRDRRPGIDPHG